MKQECVLQIIVYFIAGYEEHDHGFSLYNENTRVPIETRPDELTNPFADEISTCDDPVSEFLETVPTCENTSARNSPEMYLPGLIIHMVPQPAHCHLPLWTGLGFQERLNGYKAYVANRESFKDIIVSPSMFLDHLPWRYVFL